MDYYTYKITFKDLPKYFYYGYHRENGKPYFGSPKTWKCFWKQFEPEIQILQWFETEIEAQNAERKIIIHTWKSAFSLNENAGGGFSDRARRTKKPNRSKAHRENLSRSLTGRTLSEEHKRNLSLNHADVSGENNPFFGKTFSHTEEAKQKIREAGIGRTLSDESKEKISQTKRQNPETNKFFAATKWFNDGEISVRREMCPDGFVPGRLSWINR